MEAGVPTGRELRYLCWEDRLASRLEAVYCVISGVVMRTPKRRTPL